MIRKNNKRNLYELIMRDINKSIKKYLNENLIKYKYYPKNFNELRNLLKNLLEERGPDADLNDIDVSNITSFYNKQKDIWLFYDLDPHNINISQWDVSNVKNMFGTFFECKNFNGQGLENWNVSNVKNMDFMFAWCKKFTGQGLENWNVSNVKTMNNMFTKCKKFNCDLSNWDVSNVRSTQSMFYGCEIFTGKGLEHWNIKDIKDTRNMFTDCNMLLNSIQPFIPI